MTIKELSSLFTAAAIGAHDYAVQVVNEFDITDNPVIRTEIILSLEHSILEPYSRALYELLVKEFDRLFAFSDICRYTQADRLPLIYANKVWEEEIARARGIIDKGRPIPDDTVLEFKIKWENKNMTFVNGEPISGETVCSVKCDFYWNGEICGINCSDGNGCPDCDCPGPGKYKMVMIEESNACDNSPAD